MRPIIIVALIIILIITCIFAYNITAPPHDDISGTYVYGGKELHINNLRGTWGDSYVAISEIRETNTFELRSNDKTFPSALYTCLNGNLINYNNGVTFLKR